MSHVNRGQKTLDLWNRSKNQLERTNFKRKGKSETTGRDAYSLGYGTAAAGQLLTISERLPGKLLVCKSEVEGSTSVGTRQIFRGAQFRFTVSHPVDAIMRGGIGEEALSERSP